MRSGTSPSLRGSTWNHERGLSPLVALADLDPRLDLAWNVRSLVDFGRQSLDELVEHYDVIVMDHPLVGEAVSQGLLVPMESVVDPQALASCIAGHDEVIVESYRNGGKTYALPVDAACHVSVIRSDLAPGPMPDVWSDFLTMAARPPWRGHVATALGPIDSWCTFVTLCASQGSVIFDSETAFPEPVIATSLGVLRELAQLGPEAARDWTPIDVLEAMASLDEIWCSPVLFGYAPYESPGFRLRPLRFGNVPRFPNHTPRGVMGGAGVAVSARRPHPEASARAALLLASDAIQGGPYLDHHGQPAAISVWQEGRDDFFGRTSQAMANAFVRPTVAGFAGFQVACFDFLHRAVWEIDDRSAAVQFVAREVNGLWRDLMSAQPGTDA